MAFVERAREMDRLRGLFTLSDQGKPQVVLVSGAMASGKTELLHMFSQEVGQSDTLLLHATGARAEQDLPLGLIGQLFHDPAIPRHIGERVQALLGEDVGPPSPATHDHEPAAMKTTAARLASGLCAALLDLAAERTVVIGIDDVQYGDGTSLQILLYLLRRLKSGRLLLILNEWAVPRPSHPAFRAELLRHPNAHRIRLNPLSEAGVAEVLSEFLDEATAKQLTPSYYNFSGGNPLLLRGLAEDGLVRLSSGSETLSSKPHTGEAFRQALLTCLYRWDSNTLVVARGLAMLGRWATPATVSRLVEMNAEQVAQIVDTLARSGLAADCRFRHRTMDTAVLENLPLDVRTRMHLQAAGILRDDGVATAEVAEHLVAANDVQGQWAIDVLQDAAGQALAEDRVDFALECLELAQRECTDPAQWATLTMFLVRVQWRVQPSAAARHLAPLQKSLRAGHLSEYDAVTLTRFLLWHGRVPEARSTLKRLHEAPRPLDAQTVAALHGFQPWLYFDDAPVCDLPAVPTGKAVGSMPERQEAELSLVPNHSGLTASAALNSVLTDGPNDEAVGWAEQALASCTLADGTVGSVISALCALVHAERPEKAATWCHVFLGEARARRAVTWEALITAVRAEVLLRQGDLAAAERWAREALRLLSPHNWGVAIGYPLSVWMMAGTLMGKHDEVAGVVRQRVPAAMFHSRFALKYLHARGQHFLASNRLQAALGDFESCGELMRKWQIDLPALVPWRSDSAQVQLCLNRRDTARQLVLEQLAMPGADSPRSRGVSLRVLAASRELKQRPLLLREAVDLLQESGDRVQLVCALADLSRTHHQLGEFNRARMMGRRAMQVADECGAEQMCRRLLSTQQPADGADTAEEDTAADDSETLSDAERRVAALAAMGHTNREIGRKLYITVSTVEQHLTRVYRKLDVDRRSDLPLRLKDGDYGTPRLAMAEGLWAMAEL